jgi:phosphoadenosine phosphosulfate reductase
MLAKMGVQLPRHYAETVTSLDCMHCTAYLNENVGKMRLLRKYHPDVSTVVQGRLGLIATAINVEARNLQAARNV